MKVPANELFEVVRQVVRDEVKKVLPQMVAQHLSEQYIRKALAEQAGVELVGEERPAPRRRTVPLPSNLREIIAGTDPDDEVQPEPMENDTRGIYEPENPLVRKNENVSKLLSRNNPLAHVYQDLLPMESEEEAAAMAEQAAARDVQKMQKATGMDFGHMGALIEGMERKAKAKVVSHDEEQLERELARKRKLLDVPVRRG